MTEGSLKAKFEWRITRFEYGDRYTLMGWSGVKEADELLLEYINYSGARFWAIGDDLIGLKNCDVTPCFACFGRINAPTYLRTKLHIGIMMEKPEYDIVISHLHDAAENLRIINQTLRDRCEKIVLEV